MYNFYNLNHDQLQSENANYAVVDVNVPLDNIDFYQLFETYMNDPSEANQDQLGLYLNKINYLIGFFPNSKDEYTPEQTTLTIKSQDDLNLLICSNEDREVFLPCFISTKELRAWCKEPVYTLSVPAAWLWKFVLSQNNYKGIIFNPGSIGWSITLEHIQSLLDDINQQK